jgi:hypothetical protein
MSRQPTHHDASHAGKLAMAAQHLNAAIGRIVEPEDLAQALRSGTTRKIANHKASAAISYLFVEISPSLISACAHEAGGSFVSANQLYLETLKQSMPRVVEWEHAVEDFL